MASKNPFQGDDKDFFEGARGADGGIKKQTFGQAFAEARRAGKKTFTFNGKSYTTQTRDDQKRAAAAKAKKRDDADFAAEEARSKTARAVAGDSPNVKATRKDAAAASDKRFAKDTVRDAEKVRDRKRIQADVDTAAAKRKVSGFASGGKVRGYGMARGGKVTKIC